MPEPLSATASAAASPIVDNIFELVDQAFDLVGEDQLVAIINAKLDLPTLGESMEAMVFKYLVSKIHAVVHKPKPTA